ncbi:MAG: hypothetical protein HZB92_08325 [Euryarchaeota archaeon]|nr:hypothetical protein [Euryarchaeota archaeon]
MSERPLPWLRKPPFCTEKDCELVHNANSLDQKAIDDGYSGICCGRITEPEKYVHTYNKALHSNQVWLCIYTPFKGWLKFKMCRDDLRKLSVSVEKMQKAMGWKPKGEV